MDKSDEIFSVSIDIPPTIRKIKSCKVLFSAAKDYYYLNVVRIPCKGSTPQRLQKTGYSISEHAVHDAVNFIQFLEKVVIVVILKSALGRWFLLMRI